MDKPYLKLYKKLPNGIKVYIVDGAYVRKNMNGEFTNFAEHYRFPEVIPANEFWLDQCHGHDEYNYYIKHMAVENTLMKKNKDWGNAYSKACDAEAELRAKDKKEPIKKRLLRKQDNIEIWLVNGQQVRDRHDIDFTEGGHDLVYKWIPTNQVWIDDALLDKERDRVELHELYERDKMKSGVSYIPAHEGASIVEKKYRKHGRKALSKKEKEYIPTVSKMR